MISMATSEELKSIHDLLIANKPTGASHDSADCPLCNPGGEKETAPEGGVMSTATTFTEEDVKAAVAAAIAPLHAEITALKASDEEEAVKARIAEAVAPLEAQVEEAQSKLDTAVLEAQAAKDELTATIAYLEAETVRVTEEAAATERKEARLTQVKEAANFPEDHLTANADRWAKMSDEDFEIALAEYKLVAPKKEAGTASTEEKIPTSTAMTASANGEGAKPEGMSLVKEILDMSLRGADFRTL